MERSVDLVKLHPIRDDMANQDVRKKDQLTVEIDVQDGREGE
jgi:hypothetical protein